MKLDDTLLPILYMLAAMGFILAIKWLNSPATARRGVIVGEIGIGFSSVRLAKAMRVLPGP